MELHPGDEFAGHRIEGELGRGGWGVVYLATHLALDRPRALKILSPALTADERFAERFRRESRLAASIEHPNVVAVHHAGEEAGLLYLSMQYVPGSDLHRAIAGTGSLQPSRVAPVVAAVGGALDAAHALGLVHRDVKPANVLLREDEDGGETAFLTDFGISKHAAGAAGADGEPAPTEAALTSTGAILGTSDYLSPEQIEGGPVDGRADTYALACVAFHALTGSPPFRRDSAIATLMAHARADRPRARELVADLSPEIDRVLTRGMAIDPASRPGSSGAFGAELAAAIGAPAPTAAVSAKPIPDSPVPVTPTTGTHERVSEPRFHRPTLATVVGLVALAAVAALLVVVLPGGDGGDDGQGPGAGAGAPEEEMRRVRADATIEVGADPLGVAIGDLKVWAAVRGEGAAVRIDPGLGAVEGDPVPAPGASAVAVGEGSIWVAGGGTVHRLDPAQGQSLEIQGFSDPTDIAVGAGGIWVTDAGSGSGTGTLVRIDPGTNTTSDPVPVGAEPRAVAVGGGAAFVANAGSGDVTRVDTAELDPVGRPIDVGGRPTSIAVGLGSVWVTDVTRGTLIQIDPATDEVANRGVDAGTRPRGVAVGFGSVWVASGEESVVRRFDPQALEVREPLYRVGGDPADVAAGFDSIWTADQQDGTVSRIIP